MFLVIHSQSIVASNMPLDGKLSDCLISFAYSLCKVKKIFT